MLLASMAELQALADWRWDFVINLSESDFPVKRVDRLADFLAANRDRNFVKSHGREVQRFIQKQGLDKTFVECDTHMWRTGDRLLPAGIQIDGGSDWVALSRPFVAFVTGGGGGGGTDAAPDPLVAGLRRIFEHTLLPAESFFHTALRNSRFCNTYVDNNLHVTNWKRKLGCKCQYKHVVDWCGCSPNDFKPDDWPRLLATETKQVFFARKFEPVVSQAVILKLETWLFGQQHLTDVPNVRAYWQNVYAWSAAERALPGGRRPESTLYAVAESVLRVHVAGLHRVESVTQVNVYMEGDLQRGLLVRAWITFQARPERVVEIELWTRHEQSPQASRSSAVGKRIVHLEVSSDYDQKEQIARNFGRTLGPASEPVLVMHFTESPAAVPGGATPAATAPATFNCTCLWISPAGRLEDVTEMHVEESGHGYSVHFAKAKLRAPLVAGVWTVKVLHQRHIVGKCEFFVMPDAEQPDAAAAWTEAALVARTFGTAPAWSEFLPLAAERDAQTSQTLAAARLDGVARLRWIDGMVRRFMLLRDICFVSGASAAEGHDREAEAPALCADANWSTLSPDPKSDIYADLNR